MHGNILDANSTNKLINQSVKDAVDDKFIENGYITKGLLEAETSARTKGNEDLGAKIQAEQTRAEGKEKEISDKLAIVDGDSNTEGSFRKAIADVIANEVTRATGAESGLQAAIATKVDATALSNYVLTTALNQQVDTLNAAISAKQDAGNYITATDVDDDSYRLQKSLQFGGEQTDYVTIGIDGIELREMANAIKINPGSISSIVNDMTNLFLIDSSGIVIGDINDPNVKISSEGIKFADKTDKDIPTADGTFINVNDLASADDVSSLRAYLSRKQNKITVNSVDITDIETADITELRTIVTDLINALSASDLIRKTETLE